MNTQTTTASKTDSPSWLPEGFTPCPQGKHVVSEGALAKKDWVLIQLPLEVRSMSVMCMCVRACVCACVRVIE